MRMNHPRKGQEVAVKAPKGSVVVPVDWLHTEVLILFTPKQRLKVAAQFGLDADDDFLIPAECVGGTANLLYKDGVPFFIMFLPCYDVRIVVHECTHMAHMLLDIHGIPLGMENTETIAYMTDYLCERVFDLFMGKTKMASA